MNIEEIREYCLGKVDVEEGLPFGPNTLVFKVKNKIFLLLSLDSEPIQFNVKCNPELAIELRETFACVKPGYHMNKKHWNTIVINHIANTTLLHSWIDHSYNLVKPKEKKKA